ncbi:hypothetical protein V6Z96_008063 [Aspergillus fumigatus]
MQLLIPPRPSFQPGPFFSHPNQFQPPSTSKLIRDTLIQKYVPIYQALTPVLSPLRVCIDEQVRLQLHDSTLVFNSCCTFIDSFVAIHKPFPLYHAYIAYLRLRMRG